MDRQLSGVVVGVVSAAMVGALIALQTISEGMVLMPLLVPVIVAGMRGGRKAGLVTTAVVTVEGLYLLPPRGLAWPTEPHDVERILMLGGLAVTMSYAFGSLKHALRQAEDGAKRARVSEGRLAQIFLASPVAKSLSRVSDRVIVDVNAAYLKLFDIDYRDIVGRTPLQAGLITDESQREHLFESVEKHGVARDIELALKATNGVVRYVLVSSQLLELEGEQLMLTTFLDLTARKRAEAEAREADERLRELANHVDASFWVIDIGNKRPLYASPGYEKLWGRTVEAWMENPFDWLEVVHPEDRPWVQALFTRDDVPNGELDEYRIVLPDGSMRWLSMRLYPVRDEHGTMVRLAGVTEDITARKEAEDRFAQLAESIAEVFWLSDVKKQQILYISPVYERVWGRSPDALFLAAADWLEAVHPDDRDRVREAAMTKQAAGTYDERYRIVRPDGDTRWIHDKAFPVRDAHGRVIRVAGVAQDITEQLELQEKLAQTQKLESIGLLAGGVAHDFNNILCVMTSNLDVLGELMPRGSEQREILDEINAAADRATSLTRQLLAFGRKQIMQPQVLELNDTVDDARKMLRRMLGEDIDLRVAFDPDAGRVRVDPAQIVQVLMNLCVNARDAVGANGKISITTRADGDRALLIVSDNGPGMRPEVRARAFEPFFTTKPVGRGTGLGLSVVHGIVEQAGGRIALESEPGHGTTIQISLPVVACPCDAEDEPSVRQWSGDERILVVDDDRSLRSAASRALTSLGYQVVEAGDATAALEELRSGHIDLLVTDVVMPAVNGRELAEIAAGERPSLRVLYMSGYPDDVVVQRGIAQAEVAFLAKPFRAHTLASKVREVLDAVR